MGNMKLSNEVKNALSILWWVMGLYLWLFSWFGVAFLFLEGAARQTWLVAGWVTFIPLIAIRIWVELIVTKYRKRKLYYGEIKDEWQSGSPGEGTENDSDG